MGKTGFQFSPDGGTTKYDLRDSNIAPIELNPAHASQPYAVNEEFVLDADGLLYEATSPISQGSAIIVYPTSGYNCKLSDSVTGQIRAIKDSLGTASTKNSTSVVTESTDLVESGAVYDALGFGNKNLCNYNGVNNVVIAQCKNGVTYTFSLTSTGHGGVNLKKNDDSGSTVLSINPFIKGRNSGSFTADSDFALYLNGFGVGGVTFVNDVSDLQLEVGSTATAYEPYHASVEESKYNRSEANVLGAKNLLDTSVEKSVGINTKVVNTDTGLRVYNTSAGTYQPISFLVDIPKDTNLCLVSTAQVTKGRGSVSVVGIKQDDTTDNLATSSEFNSNTNVKLLFNSGHIYKAYRVYLFCTRGTLEEGDISYNNLMITLSSDTDPTYQPYAQTNRELTVNKCDNSIIAPIENQSTCQKSDGYAVGEHFIRDGAFCTCKQPISQGGSFTLGTNYTSGDVAEWLEYKMGTITAVSNISLGSSQQRERNGIVVVSASLYNNGVNYTKDSFTKVATLTGISMPPTEIRFPISTSAAINMVGRLTPSGDIEVYNYSETAQCTITFNFCYTI